MFANKSDVGAQQVIKIIGHQAKARAKHCHKSQRDEPIPIEQAIEKSEHGYVSFFKVSNPFSGIQAFAKGIIDGKRFEDVLDSIIA